MSEYMCHHQMSERLSAEHRWCCACLLEQRDAAIAAKEAAGEDGKLLDWLEQMKAANRLDLMHNDGFTISIFTDEEPPSEYTGATLREAIRNAMKGEA